MILILQTTIKNENTLLMRELKKVLVPRLNCVLNQYFETTIDLLVLSAAVLPPDGLAELSETLGYAIEDDGHIKELYGKLRRNETRRRVVVAVGSVTRPQFVFESITDALAGALVIHN